ncbi:MAG TPA: hypothetical protein VLQ65_08330 [Saliniramus sp.]|nr:hypothetical protein [Saliniramus sp.]
MIDTNLPPEIRALAEQPLDAAALATLRARYLPGPITAAQADELFALAATVGEEATPAFKSFLEEALATFLVADFQLLGRS